MLTIRKGYDTDYLNDAVVKGREGYYTGAVAAGEPPGRWYGAGAELLGLTGEVDPEVMKALYTHGLDPRDPNVGSRERWGKAARLGNPPRNYRKAEEIYAGLLETHPDAGPEQRAGLRAQAAASARQSVAFHDVVLSAPKSMTVLWVGCERAASDARASGDDAAAAHWSAAAKEVEEALMEGHRAVLDILAEKAGYARRGHHGGGAGEWVDAHQLVAAQFLQHDSRDHDPQLHVHGPLANKVPCADGKWLAIDSMLLAQWKWAAAAVGERVAEARVWERLGGRWETRPDGQARELVGVGAESTGMFSKRTKAIGPKMEQLLTAFQAEVGREPTASERNQLHDEAFLSTRAGKVFGGETREGQLARWADEHAHSLGVHLGDVARHVLGQPAGEADLWSERDVIARALAAVEEAKQSWNRADLMFAISQALPGQLGIRAEQVPALLNGLTDKAQTLARHLNPRTGPTGLDAKYYRANGESTFVRPGCERFATDAQLLGEAELRAAAVRRGAPAWTSEDAAEVIDRYTTSGRPLGADQAAALTGVLTSGAAVEVLAAPAGTGKSFLVGALAEAWPHTAPGANPGGANPGDAVTAGGSGGGEAPEGGSSGTRDRDRADGPRVFGLAFGQRQADVLAEEGVTARNIRRWLAGQARLDGDRPAAGDEEFRLRSGDLVVVDEAGAAPTADLVAIHQRAQAAGAKLLLVGDSRQMAAVGAGGALADVAAAGITYELSEVRRFHDRWEGPASLRLRDGDPDVVGEYAKHGRIVDAGTPEQAEQAAARVWLADTLDGRDALLVVGSNEAAARVSAGLRAELIRLGRVREDGVALGMRGWAGTAAGVGDLIQARRNAWHLRGWEGNTAAPINRATYRVTGVRPDGGLTVAPITGRNLTHSAADSATGRAAGVSVDDTGADATEAAGAGGVGERAGGEQLGEPMQLPASYVREHVTLAYASTVHAALGRTVDAGLSVLGAGTDAAAAYVQLTRGRLYNTAFVISRNTSGEADTGETHTVAVRDSAAVLADAIRPPEVDSNRTALTEAEQAAVHARSTMTQIDPMLAVIADGLTGRTAGWFDRLAAEGVLSERHRVAVAADEARGTLDGLLRSAELAGHDPVQVLRRAVTASPLDGAASVAQVLHFRIRSALAGRLEPEITSYTDLIPHHIRANPDHPNNQGLHALAAAADARRAQLGAELAADPPQWARETLGPVPDVDADPSGRAEWEHCAGWAGSYRELVAHADLADPLGAAPPGGLVEKDAVFRAAHTALDLPDAGANEEAMSEGQLRARVAAARREEAWAPRYVADELDATHEALRVARTDATMWAARADAESVPDEAAQLRAASDQARETAAQLAVQVETLTAADDARSMWLMDTAVTRDLGERSRVGLGLRGINPDDPADRVNAQDWLDLDDAEKLAADRDRPITEHDLTPDADLDDVSHEAADVGGRDVQHGTGQDIGQETDQVTAYEPPEAGQDGGHDLGHAAGRDVEQETGQDTQHEVDPEMTSPDPVVVADYVVVDDEPLPKELPAGLPEVLVPDIREISIPDDGERSDPQQRRRMPLPEETSATADRARLAIVEIETRRAAETAALADDDEPDLDVRIESEEQRRAELIRWSSNDAERPGRDAGDRAERHHREAGATLER